ncbi:MAG: hypothetical protein ACD_79C00666G0001 [uncultured bacterium]|nr:MAG: hypothetical protein ACD_79C00666G0001 [uncultured bacterium]
MLSIRKATLEDIQVLKHFIDDHASNGFLLPRTLEQISEHIRDFFVAISEDEKILGCVALQVYTAQLAEIRSLAVDEKCRHLGIGKALVLKCMEEADILCLSRVFALTKIPAFFYKIGFKEIDRDLLPEKVFKDCRFCPNIDNCFETAVIKEL